MSNHVDDRKPENNIDDNDVDQLAEDNKQAAIIRLFLSIVGLLIAGFCYLILDLTLPAGILFLVIVFFNYLEAKKEHAAELKKNEETRERRKQARLAKQNNESKE